MRPVRAGMLSYADLRGGCISLEDVLICNAYLDNLAYNENLNAEERSRLNG